MKSVREIVLGNREAARRIDRLRGGDLSVRTRHGLASSERLLLEACPGDARNVLTIGDARGVVAMGARARSADLGAVAHLVFDAYEAREVRAECEANGVSVRVVLEAHVPGSLDPGPWDAILLTAPRESALLRELVEESHDALPVGGRFYLAGARSSRALVGLVKDVFGNAVPQARPKGPARLVVSRRQREKPARRARLHVQEKEVAGVRLKLELRPGVFGARGLDAGTRLLIERLRVPPGARVLDLGAGTGVLGIAAGLMGVPREVVLVDSNARAVELARANAIANGLDSARVVLSGDLVDLGGPFDLALVNPPYYGDFRIARALVAAAHAHLAPGGRIQLVAKAAHDHAEVVRERFGVAAVEIVQGYGIIEACRAERPSGAAPDS